MDERDYSRMHKDGMGLMGQQDGMALWASGIGRAAERVLLRPRMKP